MGGAVPRLEILDCIKKQAEETLGGAPGILWGSGSKDARAGEVKGTTTRPIESADPWGLTETEPPTKECVCIGWT